MPAATALVAETLIDAVLPVILAGTAAIVRPFGKPAAVMLTAPAYPFTRVIDAVAVEVPPCATLTVVGTPSEKLCAVLVKVAVTVGVDVTTSVHVVPGPEQAPAQPPNTLEAPGVAVNVTLVPGAKVAKHEVPQLMPAGVDVTVPLPVPANATFTWGCTTLIVKGIPARAPSDPGPAAYATLVDWPGVAVAVADTVRVLVSVFPLSTEGLNDTVTPLGAPESVSVNASL